MLERIISLVVRLKKGAIILKTTTVITNNNSLKVIELLKSLKLFLFFENSRNIIGSIPKSLNFERILTIASRLLKSPKLLTPRKRAARTIAKTFVKNAAACPNESEKTFLVILSMGDFP